MIQDSWDQTEGRSILEKVQYCSLKLEEWGGGYMKEVRRSLQKCRDLMKKFRSRRDREGIRKYDDARWEFLKLLEKQEIYWKQRSKQFWLREGDQNTKFFHNYATGRKKRNQIKKLKDKNGVWKENKDELQQIITEYFEDMFKASGVDGRSS